MRKFIIVGGFFMASFFMACNNQKGNNSATEEAPAKELEMYEDSELALLMRKMYADNLEIRDSIKNGFVPHGFPEAFYKIHTAEASNPADKNETFKTLANQYLANLEKMSTARTNEEAVKLYNSVINTCASCHQIYCQGPLPKIRKMRLPE